MKKIIILSCILCVGASYADDGMSIRNQMLDSEITRLTVLRDEKYAALKNCEKTTDGFKIAGIATLATTGVGVYANIKLAQKLKGATTTGSAAPGDNRSRSEIDSSSCVQVGCPPDPAECETCLDED